MAFKRQVRIRRKTVRDNTGWEQGNMLAHLGRKIPHGEKKILKS